MSLETLWLRLGSISICDLVANDVIADELALNFSSFACEFFLPSRDEALPRKIPNMPLGWRGRRGILIATQLVSQPMNAVIRGIEKMMICLRYSTALIVVYARVGYLCA